MASLPEKVVFCKKCVMSNQRPGIIFHPDGVCNPCKVAASRDAIDWKVRWAELERLADRHRRTDGGYDCIVTVSGGKDSHFQTHVFKDLLHMNPLLLNVRNYSYTNVGLRNLDNISEAFGCDIEHLTINRRAAKIMTRLAFEKDGIPTWFWDRAVYAWPIRAAMRHGIKLIVYGENISFEYGGAQGETPSAREQVRNEAVRPIPTEEWIARAKGQLAEADFQSANYPTEEQIEAHGLEPIYLSYFTRWDGRKNYEISKRLGFRDATHEWKREGFIEQYDQIDSAGYLVHPWMKYPKYGHARATDVACYWIRTGHITREEGVALVKANDHLLDQKALDDFLAFTGYTNREFWEIVDRFYNPNLFEHKDGLWRLKHPVWEA